MSDSPERNQRPFHICPECNAYNAKFNEKCWRCEHDLTASALEPASVLGYRLEQLEAKGGAAKSESKPKP
jgi:ribosomal protein L40E